MLIKIHSFSNNIVFLSQVKYSYFSDDILVNILSRSYLGAKLQSIKPVSVHYWDEAL